MANRCPERSRAFRNQLAGPIASRMRALTLGVAIILALLLGVSLPSTAAESLAMSPTLTSFDDPDGDGDGFPASVDCDDANPAIHPGAAEKCNNADDNCDGTVDNLVDPHILDPSGTVDVHFGFCLYSQDGPAGECKTAGVQECHWPPDPLHTVIDPTFGTMTCVLRPGTIVIQYTAEDLGHNNCTDGVDNDCDSTDAINRIDIHDPDCQQPETCDGLDNDGDGVVDNGFNAGQSCSAGVGVCQNSGIFVCLPNHLGTVCTATADPPKNEGATFGSSCGNSEDDDCDGLTDLADPGCAGFGQAELCNGVDDNANGQIDEGFGGLGVACTSGTGACRTTGVVACKPDGTGTQCSAVPGAPVVESTAAGNCHDFIDNDCDGSADGGDSGCTAAFSDLGVTCSLPYRSGKAGADCGGKNIITFSGGSATEVKADLLAYDTDGGLLGIIENVQSGEEAQLRSRVGKADIDTLRNRYKIFAPVPLLRVTGTKDGIEDVAYCGILPYLDVTAPSGETISLSENKDLDVSAYLPLVNVDTLSIKLNGIDILSQLPINKATAFPTTGTALCTTPGSCVFQIAAGCGDGTLTDVEISNLRVEGLDTALVPDARDGVEEPNQVNTVNFTVRGLPPGGHVFYITGQPLPLPRHLATPCYLDDLADTGKASAFGVAVTSPTDQEIVATAPVHVTGTACGGNEIASVKINARNLDVSRPAHQTCTTGNGTTSADECFVNFNEAMPQKDLSQAVLGSAENASYKRGSNRVIADAIDSKGNRAFDTHVVFSLGPVQGAAFSPLAGDVTEAMRGALPTRSDLDKVVNDTMMAMSANIDPAFVVGLDEAGAQKFFNKKCKGAIDEFKERANLNLKGKSFGTFVFHPDCSCNLDVPVKLEDLLFTDYTESPGNETCKADFQSGVINVTVHLPDLFIKVGAHDSCTDHGIFGECIARTKVNVTGVTNVKNISFAFTITETQIETNTPPNKDNFLFDWTLMDDENNLAFSTVGHCSDTSAHPGRNCYGNKKDSDPPTTDLCGGECIGAVKNAAFDPVVGEPDVGIECWGADICAFFELIVAYAVEFFTFGLVDGKDLFVDFMGLGFDFDEDFFDALKASNPDAMGLGEVKPDEGKVEQASGFVSFTRGPIDVTIQDGGLTVAGGAEFTTTFVDPDVPTTNGFSVTPADAPTVSQVTVVGNDVTLLVADDVFNQIFASMKIAGKLKAICSHDDSLTVDQLLPDPATGGCDTFGPDNEAGAILRGICHAIRDADCFNLAAESNALQTNTKMGTCVGFSTHVCTVFPLVGAGANPIARAACAITPQQNIKAANGVAVCARQDMEPDLLIKQDVTSDTTIDTDLILEDLNVVFMLDRDNNGYVGKLEDLPGCFGAAGNAALDCKLYAACADLTLKTSMRVDSSTCLANEAGFSFKLNEVIPSSLQLGAMCAGGTQTDDESLLEQAVKSQVAKQVTDHSQDFMPPICVQGLDLNGVLNFHSADAKVFGLTTNGGTAFADFLGITVPLSENP